MFEYLKSLDWQIMAPYLMAYALYIVGVFFVVIGIAQTHTNRSMVRALAARRRSLEHGADHGWDCPKPGPFHYIPEGVTKGGRRGF